MNDNHDVNYDDAYHDVNYESFVIYDDDGDVKRDSNCDNMAMTILLSQSC